MKKRGLVCTLLSMLIFTACQKEGATQITSTTTKTPVINSVGDSVSYTIDGITYTANANDAGGTSTGIEDANRKLIFSTSNNSPAYTLVGNPDSVMYFEKNTFYSKSATMDIFFLKKFFRQQTPLYLPGLKSVLSVYSVGRYALAEDFEWQNSQNGVALDVLVNNTGYSSYNAYNGVNTIVIPPGFQKNSTFEITSFVQATNGTYNLEAKFNAVVFDSKGQQKQLTNGYVRLNLFLIYASNGY